MVMGQQSHVSIPSRGFWFFEEVNPQDLVGRRVLFLFQSPRGDFGFLKGRVREDAHAWMTMLSRHTALALALASLTRDESDRQPGEAYLSQQMHALGDILPFLHADTRHHLLSRSHWRRYRGRCIRMVEDGTYHACHTDAW